jgi:hypothetical protein
VLLALLHQRRAAGIKDAQHPAVKATCHLGLAGVAGQAAM